jgi:hypothetical protein
MRGLGIGIDRLKVVGGWGAEKLGRLKLNGRLWGYSPLSRVIELEGLLLAVSGKLALWRSLQHLLAKFPQLAGLDLPSLIGRAEGQVAQLERHRLLAATEAFGGDSP